LVEATNLEKKMGESFKASVQYGDLKGTAAIDGHETGGPLHDLAEFTTIKPGYIPVGFGLTRLHPNKDGKLPFTIYAVDANVAGINAQEMNSYATKYGTLPVTGFHGEIEPVRFQEFFKRFSIRVHSKHLDLEPEQLGIQGYDYGD
jgi:hypothetical protein